MQPFRFPVVFGAIFNFSSQNKIIMSRILFVFSLLLIGATSTLTAQWGTVRGEGEVVKQEINLPAFDGVALGFSGDVILTPGNVQKVVVEAQQNIIDNIKRDVRGGTWNIEFIKGVKEAKKVVIYITMPTVRNLVLSGSGLMRSTASFDQLKDLDISVAGSGNVSFEYNGQRTQLALSGSGDVQLFGKTTSLEIAISGSGDVSAAELVTGSCEVAISGSGDAAVHVNGDLKASIAGSGDVRYKGDASVKASIVGSGTVEKL
jgi:hypothetical protein